MLGFSSSAGRILQNFKDISLITSTTFAYLFFDSDQYTPRVNDEIRQEQEADVQMDGVYPDEVRQRRNEYNVSPLTKILRRKILSKLEDWFSFLEVKSHRNITMNLYVQRQIFLRRSYVLSSI